MIIVHDTLVIVFSLLWDGQVLDEVAQLTPRIMANDNIIKKDFMIKRSRLTGRFKKINYRSRWFVLTEQVLRYHDGTLTVSIQFIHFFFFLLFLLVFLLYI